MVGPALLQIVLIAVSRHSGLVGYQVLIRLKTTLWPDGYDAMAHAVPKD